MQCEYSESGWGVEMIEKELARVPWTTVIIMKFYSIRNDVLITIIIITIIAILHESTGVVRPVGH